MSRNQILPGIILKAGRIGEIHKGLTLLTAGRGLLSCIAHGAWKEKSKLRSATQLFASGRFHLYFNPVKDSCKVVDIEVQELYEGIREELVRYFTASLWAEVILKSYAGGEPRIFGLQLGAMKLLQDLPAEETPFLMVQFLWRFLLYAGFKPELGYCNNCGIGIEAADPLYYQSASAQFFCPACALNRSQPLSPGMRRYLEKSLVLPLEKAPAFKIEKKAIEYLKKITYHILQVLLEIQLKSLKSGEGII